MAQGEPHSRQLLNTPDLDFSSRRSDTTLLQMIARDCQRLTNEGRDILSIQIICHCTAGPLQLLNLSFSSFGYSKGVVMHSDPFQPPNHHSFKLVAFLPTKGKKTAAILAKMQELISNLERRSPEVTPSAVSLACGCTDEALWGLKSHMQNTAKAMGKFLAGQAAARAIQALNPIEERWRNAAPYINNIMEVRAERKKPPPSAEASQAVTALMQTAALRSANATVTAGATSALLGGLMPAETGYTIGLVSYIVTSEQAANNVADYVTKFMNQPGINFQIY